MDMKVSGMITRVVKFLDLCVLWRINAAEMWHPLFLLYTLTSDIYSVYQTFGRAKFKIWLLYDIGGANVLMIILWDHSKEKLYTLNTNYNIKPI